MQVYGWENWKSSNYIDISGGFSSKPCLITRGYVRWNVQLMWNEIWWHRPSRCPLDQGLGVGYPSKSWFVWVRCRFFHWWNKIINTQSKPNQGFLRYGTWVFATTVIWWYNNRIWLITPPSRVDHLSELNDNPFFRVISNVHFRGCNSFWMFLRVVLWVVLA